MQIKMTNRAKDLVVVFAGLAVVDATFTKAGIEYGMGLNLIIKYCLEHEQAFWALKVIIPTIIVACMLPLAFRYPRQVKRVMTGLIIGMALICGWSICSIIHI